MNDRTFFEEIADGAFVVDQATGRILEANAAAARAYGYSREELLALTVADLSDDPGRALEAAHRGEPLGGPRRHRRKNGTYFLADISISRLEWDGRPALVGIVRDVTVLANAFFTSPLLMSVADLVTDRYLEVNATFCERVGFSRDEMVGRTAVELGLITVPERDELAGKLMTAPKNGSIEFSFRSRAGATIACRYWGQILETPEGLRLFAVAEDVTALRQSDERFSLAMDATTDGLWDWDIATDRGYFSPGYYRMLGYEPESFPATGQSWQDLMHPDDRPAALQANLDCIEGRRERFEVEYRLRAKSGEWRWVLGRGKCIARDASGRALRLLGTHVDITERKRLQAGLAQSDRLASMGMLAAGVAHEINNPLSYVLASLDALNQDLPRLRGVDPIALADLVEAAQSALEGTRRIRKISRGLGTFSRVERVELKPIDLNLPIDAAITMAHNELKYRATLVKDLSQLPAVLGSEGKLAQVFLNLLINAAHAIGEGDVAHHHITVRSWAEGDDVFAEVTDDGPGIPPELRERVFEPFFTTKKAGEGSGLGLSISRSILTELGGELRLESEIGRGARFVVRLPVSRVSSATPAPAAQQAEASPRGRVLIIDDEDAIRRTLARLLGMHHEVHSASSGREAQALLERDAGFDVVLCDLMMPEMTGMDLHAWLTAHAPAVARRVVFVSGGAFTPAAGDYLARVDNLRVDKPFDPAQLVALVARLVADARAAVRR